jgi:hypothetical protein
MALIFDQTYAFSPADIQVFSWFAQRQTVSYIREELSSRLIEAPNVF